MTCRTFRCRQVSTWLGSGSSGISATTRGAVPLGLRPGLPLGLSPVPARFPGGALDVSPSTLRPMYSPPDRVPDSSADVSPYGARHQTSVRRAAKMSYRHGTTESHERSIEL